ncbi:MAG: hypothetical protein LBM66_06550 [Bifidobacteriaceae bacterium]|nr:hypothetical protein [Bifidobacteriaceae bacterium]
MLHQRPAADVIELLATVAGSAVGKDSIRGVLVQPAAGAPPEAQRACDIVNPLLTGHLEAAAKRCRQRTVEWSDANWELAHQLADLAAAGAGRPVRSEWRIRDRYGHLTTIGPVSTP